MVSSRFRYRDHRFSLLLGALLLYFVLSPALQLASATLLIRIGIFGLLSVVLISAVLATSEGSRWRVVLIVLAVAVAVLLVAANLTGSRGAAVGMYISFLAFVLSIVVLSVAKLMHSLEVTYETIAAAICGYTLLVVAWAGAYSLVDIVAPGSFIYSLNSDAGQIMRFGFGDDMVSLYYSFVTMTTLGYGDVLPTTDTTRMLAAIQAFVGQIYIAVLVARLVGLQIAAATLPKA